MPDRVLTCRLRLTSSLADGIALTFEIRNAGPEPVQIQYATPFLSFALEVSIDGRPVDIVKPAFDGGVRATTVTLSPGEETLVETPIRLVFDPEVAPSGGPDRNRWSLVHAPATARVQGSAEVHGARLTPFDVVLEPPV